jgi:hypothetical protein
MSVLRLSAGGVSFRHRSCVAGHGPGIRVVTKRLQMLKKIGLITLEQTRMIFELSSIKALMKLFLEGDVQWSTTGKIIVPSSLTGSPRYMINNYQDVMAICRTYENLDLFITFTCNTNWLEIQRELRKVRVYKHEDNPNIITRVLRTKLLDMLKFIKFSIPSGKKIASEMILSIFISFLSCLSFTIFICFCFCTS